MMYISQDISGDCRDLEFMSSANECVVTLPL